MVPLTMYPQHSKKYPWPSKRYSRLSTLDKKVDSAKWYMIMSLYVVKSNVNALIVIVWRLIGFYTAMLLPAAIMGLVCVIYGLAKLGSYIPV